jgi:hypothetical protein
MNSILEERGVLKDRLLKVQKDVRKATEDAWKQASSTNSTSSANPVIATPQESNASFMLGMDLFGQDPSILERGIRDKLDDVQDELNKLMLYNDENINTSLDHDNEDVDPHELARQAQSYQQQIRFLKQASLARSMLEESITLSSAALTNEPNLHQASRQLVVALEHAQEAEELASSTTSPQEAQVARQILEGLRHSIRRHRVELVHKASSVLDASIQMSHSTLLCKGSTQLLAAYQVLESLEGGHAALEETLRRLTQRLYKEVLSPILEPHRTSSKGTGASVKPWKVVESADKPTKGMIGVSVSTTKGPVHRMEWHRTEEGNPISSPIDVWKDTLELLQGILVFLQSKILLERPKLCKLVGDQLFGKPNALPSNLNLQALGLEATVLGDDKGVLMETLVELISETCLPDALPASEIPTLADRGKELLDACVPFCKELVHNQLLPKDPPPKLVTFCQQFEQKYVEHRRCVLLNQARDSLMNNDYHNTVVVGVDVVPEKSMAIFQLHKSSISDTASNLMTLVRQTMDESVAMPTQPELLRPALYRTAREMLSLFRAIIPASHGSEVAHVPRTAAVLHNDCIYFAHHCLTLGLEYKEQFDEEDARGKLLQQTCIFVDMVPLFRELADTSMGDMLDLQKHQLAEIVGSRITYLGQALQSRESLHEWSEAETALAAGSYHLRHLSQAWKPILSTQVFCRSMGYLADVLITLYWNQVTQATSISPSARHFLLGVFRKASDDLSSLMEGNFEGSNEWQRFSALVQFLDLPHLSHIQAALTNGVFRQVASVELAKWIQATFEESGERRVLLQNLATVA